MDKYIIEYIDKRPVSFPQLHFYKNGISFPRNDNKIQVTENEKKRLLMMKNGKNPCFQEVRQHRTTVKAEESEE